MELSLVFNELSRHSAKNEETARQWMNTFAQVVKLAAEKKIRSFRTDFEFSQIELAANYPIEKWYNDHRVDEPTREFIKDFAETFQLIKPFIADLPADDEVVERSNNLFAKCYEKDALGLTYAHLTEGLGISFLSDEIWDAHQLPLILYGMPDEEDEEAEDFIPTSVQVAHTAQIQHFDFHEDWIADRLRFSVGNGSVLWTKVKTWYPHVVFCKNSEKQIKELKSGTLLHWVIRRLFDLEEYCKTWEAGGFDGSIIADSSHESTETINSYGSDREFACPDGQIRLFEYHLKGKVNNQHKRIHIWADEKGEFGLGSDQHRKILVGYIGNHLSTVNNPT